MPDAFRENEFELVFRDASARHGAAVNQRRPFSRDLLYPLNHSASDMDVLSRNTKNSVNNTIG